MWSDPHDPVPIDPDPGLENEVVVGCPTEAIRAEAGTGAPEKSMASRLPGEAVSAV